VGFTHLEKKEVGTGLRAPAQLGVAWAWLGRAVGVAWAQLGRGLGAAWAWRGRGLGVAWAWRGLAWPAGRANGSAGNGAAVANAFV